MSTHDRPHRLLVLPLALLLVVVAACGGGDDGDDAGGDTTADEPTEAEETDAAEEPVEDETADAETEAAATEPESEDTEAAEEPVEDLGDATIMLGGRVITWAATWVGVCEGFFMDHGLNVEVVPSEGGTTPAIAALVSGEILAALTGSAAGIGPIREGAPVQIALVASQGYGVQFTASNEWLEQAGVSPDDSIEDRVRAMQGARVAINNPGGSVQAMLDYVLPQYDMDPQTDITMISLGDYPPMLAAMQQGEVDLFGASPPWGSRAFAEGLGEVYLSGTEVEGLDTLPYLTADLRVQDIENEPERVIALIRGLADAIDFLNENPDGGRECVREQFPDMDEATFDDAYDFAMTTLPEDPAMTPERWAALEAFGEASGAPLGVAFEDAVPVDILEEALGGR